MTGSPVPWRLAADTGGTFTDVVAVDPAGRSSRAKVLSSSALRGRVERILDERTVDLDRRDTSAAGGCELLAGCKLARLGAAGQEPLAVVAGFDPATGRLRLEAAAPLAAGEVVEIRSSEPAPVLAARLLTGTPQNQPLPPMELRLATTRGTNALLERRGARTAFLVTRGFRDLLAIATQERPELFARRVVLPAPLPEVTLEVHERLAADGTVVEPLDLAALEPEIERLVAAGFESAAVASLHAYRNPDHERAVAAALARHGFRHVAVSSELAPRIKLLPRAETAVVEAYLAPVVGSFLATVAAALPSEGRLLALTSAGGLAAARDFRAKDSLLSGPAGGVVGAVAAARRSGFERLVGFDMGGTSTDVARFDGELEYVFEQRVAGTRLLAPALAIETVAAGGGSVVSVKHGRLQVGPESAGAAPGPACYGAGGPLTVTDVDFLLGRLDAELFGLPIDRRAAEQASDELLAELRAATGEGAPRDAVLEGCLAMADERMADAIRRISVRRGYDPADHVLVAFGGAGVLHACAVAERLGMTTVLVPADAGLLSAVGLAGARLERFAERTVLRPLSAVEPELPGLFAELAAEAGAAVRAAAGPGEPLSVDRRLAFLRLLGQEATLAVEITDFGVLAAAFERAYRELYGYPPPAERAIELESIRLVAGTAAAAVAPAPSVPALPVPPGRRGAAVFGGRTWPLAVHARGDLAPGMVLGGPALVVDRHATALVAPGWRARVDGALALVIEREDRP